jgi:hypothetical protein
MRPPAHKTYIERYLDWARVEEQLAHYEHIRRLYPINFLKRCSDRSPYYCHYLAWRLGTWENEQLFEFMDDLFATGTSLKNWDANNNLLRSCTFDDFWGLIWQLQIAKFFCRKEGVQVEWMKSGPDLKVELGDEMFYVECYTYRKSFGIEEFICELFLQLNEQIRIEHIPCIHFSLPNDAHRLEVFLDTLFRPYLDSAFLDAKLKQAELEYPVLLPTPNGVNNLYVYIEGNEPGNYVPGRIPNSTGDPETYLKHSIDEGLNNKRDSNRLGDHHPNLLAVNYLLDVCFQMALHHQINLGWGPPSATFSTTFDAVLLAACGIDQVPSTDASHLEVRPGEDHPVLRFWRPTTGRLASGDA